MSQHHRQCRGGCSRQVLKTQLRILGALSPWYTCPRRVASHEPLSQVRMVRLSQGCPEFCLYFSYSPLCNSGPISLYMLVSCPSQQGNHFCPSEMSSRKYLDGSFSFQLHSLSPQRVRILGTGRKPLTNGSSGTFMRDALRTFPSVVLDPRVPATGDTGPYSGLRYAPFRKTTPHFEGIVF